MSNVTGPDTAPDRDQRFERLAEAYQGSVLRLCYLTLCDKTLAEDATQETFLKIWRKLDRYEARNNCSVRTWIMRVACNTCKDQLRKGWRKSEGNAARKPGS